MGDPLHPVVRRQQQPLDVVGRGVALLGHVDGEVQRIGVVERGQFRVCQGSLGQRIEEAHTNASPRGGQVASEPFLAPDAATKDMRRPSRVTAAVLVVTAVALLTRFVGLGARPFHWDEARVGYWTLRSLETGVYEYRPVAGAPFVYLATRFVFGLVGASDATARAVVALVGGLLPAAALLYHDPGRSTDRTAQETADHGWRVGLNGTETVSLALLLTVAPPLLYYSRFLRGDLPLAAFGLVAFGCFVRARRTGSRRSLYAGAVAVGLALSSSALAVAMVACWLVATVLSFDEARVERVDASILRSRARRVGSGVADRATPLARSLFVTLAVVVFFFAPRGGPAGLYDPATLPAALYQGSFGAVEKFVGVFVLGRHNPPYHTNGHALVPYVEGIVSALLVTALPIVALALYGFLRERYSGRSRPMVTFAAYWGGVGVLFFAGATEVNAPWVAVHVLAPLCIPAAVGLASFVDFGRGAISGTDAVPVAVAVLLVLAGGVHIGAVVDDAYAAPGPDSELSQYAQSGTDLRPAMENATVAIEGNEGVDVLYVGAAYDVGDESSLRRPPVPESERAAFSGRLPLSWYFERAGARTESIAQPEGLGEDPPPVVITSTGLQGDVSQRLGGDYRIYEVELGLYDRTVVMFVKN